MKSFRLEDMTRGWFIGDFEPSVYRTQNCEVAIKKYKKGDNEKKHYHKCAIEITTVVSGIISFNDIIYKSGDIIFVDINESIKFKCIEDAITVVYKSKSIKDDKYIENC